MKKPKTDKMDAESQGFFDRISREYQLTCAGLELLKVAAHTLSRWRQAKAILDIEGLYVKGQIPRIHPAAKVEHDCRLSFCRMLKELSLDSEAQEILEK
jgi:hypothetical protein